MDELSTDTTEQARAAAATEVLGACSTTSRRSSTASGRRSGSCSRRSSAAATCSSRTFRERRRRSSPRDRREHRGLAAVTHPVHPRPAADRRDGLSVFNQELRRFEFQAGPMFANILLVDEINRAMPKTQSALLEAMAEHQVTVDGVTRPLPEPLPADRDREPDRVRGHLSAARGAARPLLHPHEPRLPGRGGRAADRPRAAPSPPARELLVPVVSADEIAELRRSAEDVYVDPLLDAGWSRSPARPAPSPRSTWAPRCAGRSR